MRSSPLPSRRPLVVALALACLVTTACGNRLPREEIVAAAGGGSGTTVTQDGTAVEGSDGSVAVDGADPAAGDAAATDEVVTSGAAPEGEAASSGAEATGGGSGEAAGSTDGGAAQSGPAAPATKGSSGKLSTILLGNVGGYSGPVGASTASAQTMLKVWQAHVNSKGGINGHPVKVISADDQSDPAKSRALVRDMVENKKVVAFLGNQMALTAEAPRAYLEEKKVPAVGGDLTSVWHKSPMYFAQGATLNTIVIGLAAEVAAAGKKKLGVLYCAEAGACKEINDILGAQGGAKSQGVDLAYSAQISLAQPDFTSECISARNAGVEALSVVADVGTTNRVASSCARQNYRPIIVNTGNTVNDAQEDNPNLNGAITTQNWFGWALKTGPGAEYQAAIKRYAPNLQSTAATASVWTSAKLLERALTDVGPGPVTSQVILESLWRLKNETLGGLAPPLTFTRGKPSMAAPCYFAMQVQKKEWTVLAGGKPRCLR